MRITAIINSRAGSTPPDAQRQLAEALDGDATLTRVLTPGSADMRKAMEEIFAEPADLVVVWGGDGTIACALEHSSEDRPPVLPLPGGTMNMLPARVHGAQLSWRDCLSSALDSGVERRLPSGATSDGRTFYVGAILGDLARLAESREALREGRPVEAATNALSGDALTPSPNLEWSTEEQREQPLKATALGVFLPAADDAPHFEIGAITPENILDLVGIGLDAAIGDWRKARSVAFARSPRLTARTLIDQSVPATLDGEPMDLSPAVELHLRPGRARVLSARTP